MDYTGFDNFFPGFYNARTEAVPIYKLKAHM